MCLPNRGQGGGDVYVAFNAHHFAVDASLPAPSGSSWARLVDTNLPPPHDFATADHAPVAGNYLVQPYSSIILITV